MGKHTPSARWRAPFGILFCFDVPVISIGIIIEIFGFVDS